MLCVYTLIFIFNNLYNVILCDLDIPCPILEVPVRGYKVGNSNSFGDVVSFFCNQGFSLSGSNTRTCQLDGTWNGDSAVCTGRTHLHNIIKYILNFTIK